MNDKADDPKDINEDLQEIMKLSEQAFSEWNNEEDAVYDRL